MVVIAALYILFAALARSQSALLNESLVASLFIAGAYAGFRFSLWLVVLALVDHGIFDFVHPHLIHNPGVPVWWPAFCMSYDVVAGGYLAAVLLVEGNTGKLLDLKVPPVALTLIAGLQMWLTCLATPDWRLTFPWHLPAAMGLGCLGVLISLAGVIAFRRARTTVNPRVPSAASSLVVSGIYRVTRNPMYLGFLLILLGWGAFLSSPLALIWVPVFVLYLNRFQINPEEQAMAALFPKDFAAYKRQVRRWI